MQNVYNGKFFMYIIISMWQMLENKNFLDIFLIKEPEKWKKSNIWKPKNQLFCD